MFDISFLGSDPASSRGRKALRGRIVLGKYSEEFDASLGIWDRTLYELHWLAAARRIVDGGRRSTAFFTTTFQSFWPMWLRGDGLVVHEKLLIGEALVGAFDPADLYRQIGGYRRYTGEGEPVSEWNVTIKDLESFVRRSSKKRRAG